MGAASRLTGSRHTMISLKKIGLLMLLPAWSAWDSLRRPYGEVHIFAGSWPLSDSS
jgi:hypothetical protein